MSESERFHIDKDFKEYPKLVDTKTDCFYHFDDSLRNVEIFCERLNELAEENEQLHYKLQQTERYLQTKIDECKNHNKMKEIVFGVEQAVGYEKALLQFQKGLKRRLNDE